MQALPASQLVVVPPWLQTPLKHFLTSVKFKPEQDALSQTVQSATLLWVQAPVERLQESLVQTLLSLHSLSKVQPPQAALVVQVSVHAVVVLAVEAQPAPEQALWVPETAG